MNKKKQNRTSKFLSLVLRHKPETIGLQLDREGWAETNELIAKMNSSDHQLSFDDLKLVVENNEKKRFVFSEDLSRIRANQGHSLQVDLNLKSQTPPDVLFHGTATRNIKSIQDKGLLKGQRHHVHLSVEEKTAKNVGQRYGEPIVLKILAKQMFQQGFLFYCSENGVWLTEHVSVEFIKFE